MKVVKPIEITEAVFTASSVAEPDITRGEAEWEENRLDLTSLTPAGSKDSVSGCYVTGVGYILLNGIPPLSSITTVDIYDDNLNFVRTKSINSIGLGKNWAIMSIYDDTDNSYSYPTISTIDDSDNSIWLITYSNDMQTVISSKKVPIGFSIANYTFSKNWALTKNFAFFSGYNTIGSANNNAIFKIDTDSLAVTETPPDSSTLKNKSQLIMLAGSEGVTAMSRSGSAGITTAYILNEDLTPVKSYPINPPVSINSRYAITDGVKASFFNGVVYSDTVDYSENYSLDYKSLGIYVPDERAIKTNTHKLYQCSMPTFDDPEIGVNKIPQTWVEVGPTNKWAIFDDKKSTPTVSSSPYTIQLVPGVAVDSMAATNISGATEVQIIATSASAGEVYNRTIQLLDIDSVTDFYNYFLYELESVNEFTIIDIPIYNDLTIDITFTGSEISVGRLATGRKKSLGELLVGASSDRIDYSRSEFDEFGELTYVARPIVKYSTYPVAIDKKIAPSIERYLDSIKGIQAVWIGDIGNDQFLTTFGAIERSPLVYDNLSIVEYQIKVRGSI